MGGIYESLWDKYIQDIFTVLIDGIGWAQIVEFSLPQWAEGDLPEESAVKQYYELMREGHRRRGTICTGGEHIEGRMRDAGFVDIQTHKKFVAIGDWPGEAETLEDAAFRRATSRCFFENARDLIEDQPIFKETYPLKADRKLFADRVWEECYNRRYPLFTEMYFAPSPFSVV